ncbi:MAG: ArsR family transcriptional regulator [Magnetospirillum sp.]|nr:ArsR family transcriptional regulator [Magnetospirillum sp.]
MTLDSILREERRLAALKVLTKAPGRSANAYVLHRALTSLGHPCALDQVRTELAWLAEQGLLAAEDLGNGMVVATLTQRGADVGAGLARVPGVAEPYGQS